MNSTQIVALIDKLEGILYRLIGSTPNVKAMRSAFTRQLLYAEQYKAELWDSALTDRTSKALYLAILDGETYLKALGV